MSIYKQSIINEAKAEAKIKGKIEVKCLYCANSEGEHQELKNMWKCKVLGYYATAYRGCDAMRRGLGNFKVDAGLYKEWMVNQEQNGE